MTQPTPPNSPFYPAGNSHPMPVLSLVQDHIAAMDDAERFPDNIATRPSPDPLLPPYSLNPSGGEIQSIHPGQPHEIRTPAVIHYPKSREILFLQSGVNVPDHMLGFAARSFAVQNLGTNQFLFCPELNMYITAGPTTFAAYNIPEGTEKLSFQWHTALFNPITPAPVVGQGAVVWIYDEWVIPAVVVSGNVVSISGVVTVTVTGTVTVQQAGVTTAAQTNVAQNAASVGLLALNANRKGASIFNDSASILYVSFAAVASLTAYKVAIQPQGYYEFAPEAIYTGALTGIWAAAGAGAARITELTP